MATSAVGLALGLIGGGGSILTVPILVYLFGIGATQATGYALFIVGATALAGALAHGARGAVSVRVAAVFAGPSLVAAYLVRRIMVPALPATFEVVHGWHVPRDVGLMLAFATVMAAAAIGMIRSRYAVPHATASPHGLLLSALGVTVGGMAGLFGAGGGFLIVPALVLVAGLPMALAVGTSLAIIAVQSLAGFLAVLQTERIDWPLVLGLTAVALGGMGAGLVIGRRVCGTKLKASFGWFVLAMSMVIVAAEAVKWSAGGR